MIPVQEREKVWYDDKLEQKKKARFMRIRTAYQVYSKVLLLIPLPTHTGFSKNSMYESPNNLSCPCGQRFK